MTYTYPAFLQGLCHCSDCRKITGSLYSYNFVVKRADLKIIGSPKELAKIADSGTHIKNYFCADCGVYCTGLYNWVWEDII
jgi:hypothetical protein